MPDQTCSRCDTELERPYPKTANYVRASDLGDTEPREVHEALVHTHETEQRVDEMVAMTNRDKQTLAAEMANPDAPQRRAIYKGTKEIEDANGAVVETAVHEEEQFSIPIEKFDREEVQSPRVVKDRDDVAYVQTRVEERDVEKTGVVCPSCTKDSDELIWGVDA